MRISRWRSAVEHFDEIQASGYSVSLFTDWTHDRFTQVWVKRVVAAGDPLTPASSFFGATLADADRHPIAGISAEHCTPQTGRTRSVVRATTALSNGLHAEQRRGAPIGVLRAEGARRRRAPRDHANGRPYRARTPRLGGANGRGRHRSG